MRTITVQGTAEKSVRPDTLRFELALSGRNKDYATAALESGRKANLLATALEKAGIAVKPAMSDFTVMAENEYVQEKSGAAKTVFKGYLVRQRVTLELPLDMEAAGRVFDALSSSKTDAELNLEFLLKDRAAAEEALLREAVGNAKRSAERIADAAGVRLGRIIEVQYHGGTPHRAALRAMSAAPCAADAFNIAPEDLRLSDNVTVVWEIV